MMQITIKDLIRFTLIVAMLGIVNRPGGFLEQHEAAMIWLASITGASLGVVMMKISVLLLHR